MPGEEALITSLRAAVAAAPDDVPLRVHLADLLLASGDTGGAIAEAGAALRADPGSAPARSVMARALAEPPAEPPSGAVAASGGPAPAAGVPTDPAPAAGAGPPAAEPADVPGDSGGGGLPGDSADVDWAELEDQLGDLVAPRFVDSDAEHTDEPAYSVQRPTITLADVGGMEQVKERLEIAFLAPMRNPELRALYRKSLRGGLLLYGPPGCGKTFLASALAGELGARFIAVGIADVLDMYTGASERNLHDLFALARRNAPVVLFLDEVDALGQKRSQTRNTAMRSTVNQLLMELDGVSADGGPVNEGVFVLAATNQPWDVDPALSRPGRFDRTVLVVPPDAAAREEILRRDLAQRPVAGIELERLVRRTDGFSGADLVHLCDTAAERALADSVRTGDIRMITMADLESALDEVRPSTGRWLESARAVAMFANEGGAYDDLIRYLKHVGKM